MMRLAETAVVETAAVVCLMNSRLLIFLSGRLLIDGHCHTLNTLEAKIFGVFPSLRSGRQHKAQGGAEGETLGQV